MTADELQALLDRLGYGAAQGADAAGVTATTMHKYLLGRLPVPKPVALALERHEKLVTISDAVWGEKRFPMTMLEERIPAARLGRPPRAA